MATIQTQHVQAPSTSSRHMEFCHWRLQVLELAREAQRQVVPKFLLMSSDDFLHRSDSLYSTERVQCIELGLPCSTKSRSAKKVRFDLGTSSAKRLRSPEIVDLTESPLAKKARKRPQKPAKKNVVKEVKPPKDPFVNKTSEDSAMIMAKISRKAKSQEGSGSEFSTPTKPKAKREAIVKFTFPTFNTGGVAAEEKERIVGGIDITGITSVHIYPFHVHSMMNVEEHCEFFSPKTFVDAILLQVHELFTHPPSPNLQAASKSFSTTSGSDILTLMVTLMDSSSLDATTSMAIRHMLTVLHYTPYLSVYQTFFNMFDAAIKVTNTVFEKHSMGGACDDIKVLICKAMSGFIEYDIGCYWEDKRIAAGDLAEIPGIPEDNSSVAGVQDEMDNKEGDEGVSAGNDFGSPTTYDEGVFAGNDPGSPATYDDGNLGGFGNFDDDLADLEYRLALERESDFSMPSFRDNNPNLRGGAGSPASSLNSLFSGGSNPDVDGEFEFDDTPVNEPASSLNSLFSGGSDPDADAEFELDDTPANEPASSLNSLFSGGSDLDADAEFELDDTPANEPAAPKPALESNNGNGGPKHCSSIGGAPKDFHGQLTLLGIKADPKIVNLKVLIAKIWPSMFKARLEEILDNAGVGDELLEDWLGRDFR